MGKSQRRKGLVYERDIWHRFEQAMPGAHVQRGRQDNWKAVKNPVPDLIMPVFSPEIKTGVRPSCIAAFDQAIEMCPEGKIPLAVVKHDRRSETVTLYLEDFLELVKEWWELKNR